LYVSIAAAINGSPFYKKGTHRSQRMCKGLENYLLIRH
jgi:hypothetical protein